MKRQQRRGYLKSISLTLAVAFALTGVGVPQTYASEAGAVTESRNNLGVASNSGMAQFEATVNSVEWSEATELKGCGADVCFENGRKKSQRDPQTGDLTEFYNDDLNRVKRIVRVNGDEERFVAYAGDSNQVASKYFYSDGVLRSVSSYTYRNVAGRPAYDVKTLTDGGLEYKMSYGRDDAGADILQSFSVGFVSLPSHLGSYASPLFSIRDFLSTFQKVDSSMRGIQGDVKLSWDPIQGKASYSMGWTLQGTMGSGGLFTATNPDTGEKWSIKLAAGANPAMPFYVEEMRLDHSVGTGDAKLSGSLIVKMNSTGYVTETRLSFTAPRKYIPALGYMHDSEQLVRYTYGTVTDGKKTSAVVTKTESTQSYKYNRAIIPVTSYSQTISDSSQQIVTNEYEYKMILGSVYLAHKKLTNQYEAVYSDRPGFRGGYLTTRDEANEFVIVNNGVQLARQKMIENWDSPAYMTVVTTRGVSEDKLLQPTARYTTSDVKYEYVVLGGKTFAKSVDSTGTFYNPAQQAGPWSNAVYSVSWDRRENNLSLIGNQVFSIGGTQKNYSTSYRADGGWYTKSASADSITELAVMGGTVVVTGYKYTAPPTQEHFYGNLPARIPGYREDMTPDELMRLLDKTGLLSGDFKGMSFDQVRVRADQSGFDPAKFSQAGRILMFLIQNKGIDMDHALMKERVLSEEYVSSSEGHYEYQMINGRPYETAYFGHNNNEFRYHRRGVTNSYVREFKNYKTYDEKGLMTGKLDAYFGIANGQKSMYATYAGRDVLTGNAVAYTANIIGDNAANLLSLINSARPEDGKALATLATRKVVEKTITVPVAAVPALTPAPAVVQSTAQPTPVAAPTPAPAPAPAPAPVTQKEVTYRVESVRPSPQADFRAVKVYYPELKLVSIVVGQADIESDEQDDILIAEEQDIDLGYRVSYGYWESPNPVSGNVNYQYGLMFQKVDQNGRVYETSIADLSQKMVLLGDSEYEFMIDSEGRVQLSEPIAADDYGMTRYEYDEQGRVVKAVLSNGRWITTEYLIGSIDPAAKKMEILYAADGSILRKLEFNSTGKQMRRIEDTLSGKTMDCFTSECWEGSIGAVRPEELAGGMGVRVAMIESTGATDDHIGGVEGILNKLLLPNSALSIYQAADHEETARAIRMAADLGNRVINLSLDFNVAGITSWAIQTGRNVAEEIEGVVRVLKNAIDYAKSLGAVIVAAAGNSNAQTSLMAQAGALTVGAADYLGRRHISSNFGAAVTLMAPGLQIASQNPILNKTRLYSGTSIASPMVAGVIASLFSVDMARNGGMSHLDQDKITTLLKKTSQDMFRTGWDTASSWGMIDQGAALAGLSMLN